MLRLLQLATSLHFSRVITCGQMTSDPGYYRRISDTVERTRAGLPPEQRGQLDKNAGRFKHAVLVGALSLCVLLAVMYACDYLVARYRAAKTANAFGTVQIERLYAIHQKGGKTEYHSGGTETQSCLHSLFPHFAIPPCWYARRHTEQRTDF